MPFSAHQAATTNKYIRQRIEAIFRKRVYLGMIKKAGNIINAHLVCDADPGAARRFPNDAAALKCLYLVTRSLDPTGRGRARWVIRWKAALNAFAITFDGRINPSSN